MENLLFSLNATLPIFLTMLCGYGLRRVGLISESLASGINRFVFQLALPVLLFQDLFLQDFAAAWNGKFVLFCFLATLSSILLISVVSGLFIKDLPLRGEFIQVSYRSSAAILGIAFIQNIYGTGNSGMGPLMILGSVPLYNIFAVIILSLTADGGAAGEDRANGRLPDGRLLKKTLLGIIKNPIILGVAAGFIWSLLKIPRPAVFVSVVHNIAVLATPLGLLSMGASFDFRKISGYFRLSLTAAFIKLLLQAAIFLPIAIACGFRSQELIALIVMLGSASTVTCYIMAKNMGHDGVLSSTTVMLTTIGCAFTLTFWLWLLRMLGLV